MKTRRGGRNYRRNGDAMGDAMGGRWGCDVEVLGIRVAKSDTETLERR